MPKLELEKTYDAGAVESRLYAQWEERGMFRAHIRKGHPTYVIMMPP